MFLKRYLFLNFLLACEITIHTSYGLNLQIRKQIYDQYVSLNKFEGDWIDPYSSGLFDGGLKFEEEPEDSDSEEIIGDNAETWKSPESFSRHRIFPKSKLQDGMGVFLTESNAIFSLGRNSITAAALLAFVVIILLLCCPKTLIFLFVAVASIFWHWMKMYQEKIAEKQNLTENLRHPNECRRGDLHWYEAIYLYLSSYTSSPTDCKEYYKATLVDPFWEVSLPVAMMNAFTSTVCEPMKVFAVTLRYCFEVIFSGLTLLQLSIALFAIFIFFLMLFGYSFSFCWGAISLYRPRSSANQIASQSSSLWGMIAKCLKSLFFWKSEFICPLEARTLPDNKKVGFSSKDGGIIVSDKPDEFEKQEKSTVHILQNAIPHSGSLNFEKNYSRLVVSKIPKFRKCHKKSLSC